MPEAPPRAPGLYVHVPFCARVCPYCDFAVVADVPRRRAGFVDLLLREASLHAAALHAAALGAAAPMRPPSAPIAAPPSPPFDTVYLGGGTPSILPPDDLARLLDGLRARLPIDPGAALFLEANPEDATPERVRAWRELGVGTLSLGVQALEAEELRLLGRTHSPESARRAVALALEAGFDTVSLDLMYGWAGHATGRWRQTLDQAAELGVPHVSCYQLTFHERTRFGKSLRRGETSELGEDAQADLFLLAHERLAERGLAAYEVSSFARAPEHRSRHNLKYWEHAPYLGIGPGAHSFDGWRRRWWNERALGAWTAALEAGRLPVEGEETLDVGALATEALMLGLRRADGIDLAGFRARFGLDLAAGNAQRLSALAADGLVSLAADRLRPTARGMAVADGIARTLEARPPAASRLFTAGPRA